MISEEQLKKLSQKGTVRITCRAMGRGFQVTGYAGNEIPGRFDLRGEDLEALLKEAAARQKSKG